MARKKQYEESYAGYIYEKPVTYWTSAEAVKRRLTKVDLANPAGICAGGMPVISDGKTAYIDAEDGHTAIIASSGMKKSICGFMPLIAVLGRAGENMIVTDPKGELYQRTAGFLQSLGYTVYCLDFRSMDKDCFNILSYAASVYRSGDKDRGLSLLSDIINVLAEDQRKNSKDRFWPDTGALWLNGTGAIMLDAYPKLEQINILNWSDFNVRTSASILEEQLLSQMPDTTVKSALRQCCSAAENTFRSILITASSFFVIFNQNPKLASMLSSNTFTLADLVKPRTALFLVTDDTTSTADPILGIILNQIQTYLVDKAFHSKNGRIEPRMNFLLDEFASLPLPNMDKALATHRSRNIRYYLCAQSLALLKKRYDDPEILLSNCNSTLFLGSTELELLQQIGAKLGDTDITPDGSTRPLCSPAELMTLEKAWNYKEAIYMDLSRGIRYSTRLPSIEAYNLGSNPPPTYRKAPPAIQAYSVAEFAKDVIKNKIRAPFSPDSNEDTNTQKHTDKRAHSFCNTPIANEPDDDMKKELRKRFTELFGPIDDE
ncbi:MAG: type IV secretory system conjugative DNA transfer family protein [Gemmiger sp.]